jgi:hypothetical protein
MSSIRSVSVATIDSFWSSSDAKKKKKTQLERYEEAHAPDGIMKIIRLGGGPAMGTTMEKIARYSFDRVLLKRSKGKGETGYDHLCTIAESPSRYLFVEQKSSGLWKETPNSFTWQHIEPAHKWQFLLLAGIQFDGIDYWVMSRPQFEAAVAAGAATNQGNKSKESSEGYWMDYADISSYLTPIKTKEEMVAFAATIA